MPLRNSFAPATNEFAPASIQHQPVLRKPAAIPLMVR
jgi:hypothetical protein